MNAMEILGALTAAALLAYLTVALLKPEWFS
jgi:K+-transporting ATPase KdpF subunit